MKISNKGRTIRNLLLGLALALPAFATAGDKDKELQLKLAAQTAGAKQGDLLEQMAFTAEMSARTAL